MKMYAFMAGLPRSGSTLLSSILNQNPNVYSSPNSPMCGMMWNLERSIVSSEQWSAYPKPHVLPNLVTGLLDSFYTDIDKSLVIDKSREWSIPDHFEVLTRNLGYKPKVILPVRSIIEILASFINLVRSNPNTVSFIDKEIEARQEFNFYRPADDIRCDSLMRPKGPIDNALYGIAFAIQPNMKEYFHIVEYDDLISNTSQTLSKIYNFLEIDNFDHDFTNITNVTHENDEVYGLRGMHDVGRRIVRSKVDIASVLSPYVLQKYSNMEFWRNYA